MDDILNFQFIKEISKVCTNLYNKGWDERNGGNISYLLDDFPVKEALPDQGRNVKIGFDASYLAGRYFCVTGTGSYFKNIEENPTDNLGIIRVADDGKSYDILWGYGKDGGPTSEIPTHFMAHITRLKINKNNRVVLHCHATHTIAMTMSMPFDEVKFTRTLWTTMSECAVVFPEGVGLIPWMIPGSVDLGVATAEKLKDFRTVVWASHGVFGVGKDIDEAFGLVETVEKSAEIYTHACSQGGVIKGIEDEQILAMEPQFGFKVNRKFLKKK